MKANVEEFKGHIPLVQVMFNPGLRERHWLQMSEIIGYTIKADEDMNLAKMVDMKLEPYLTKFEGISEAASKEFSLEKAMEKMVHEWDEVSLIIIYLKEFMAADWLIACVKSSNECRHNVEYVFFPMLFSSTL